MLFADNSLPLSLDKVSDNDYISFNNSCTFGSRSKSIKVGRKVCAPMISNCPLNH
ncbi:hypothetical protein EVA_10663 [gut metagenome]|uniref:Uncharacterized protein n=1 Tax=gut metagenome TaxID=749906 RepID=J9G1Y6_9ZZZZ